MRGGMADFLRELDPAHRAFLVIFIVVTLKAMILVWWGRFKHAESGRPIPLKLRKGIYVPWARSDKVEHYMGIAGVVWLFCMAALLALLAWHKLVQPVI